MDPGRTRFVVRTLVEELGDERHVIFDVDAPPVDSEAIRAAIEAHPDCAALLPEGKARFTAQLPADVPAVRGEPLRLAIDPDRLYLFDPATNQALDL